jgi:hypothetical protein
MNIYFYAHPHGNVYHDDLVYLAEGFEALGHKLYGNRNLWRGCPESDKFLITHDPAISDIDADLIVVAGQYQYYTDTDNFSITSACIPEALLQPSPRVSKWVLTDQNDGWKTASWQPWARRLDMCLRVKLNSRCDYPSNVRPWVHGFTDRVKRMSAPEKPFSERKRAVLDNFGFSHPYSHDLRDWARSRVYPKLEQYLPVVFEQSLRCTEKDGAWNWMMFQQTQGKHNPDYYGNLCNYQIVSCFCGSRCPSIPRDASKLLVGGKRALIRRKFYSTWDQLSGAVPRLIQWDSWRFWETLICGAVALHYDLEKGGVTLPVMPVPGVHYLACDEQGRVPSEWLDAERLEAIAQQGRLWALEHYCPLASSSRLLDWISKTS